MVFGKFEFSLLAPETGIILSIIAFIVVSAARKLNGGHLIDADRVQSDGIAFVVVYVTALLWWGLIGQPVLEHIGDFDFGGSFFDDWKEQPLGWLTISVAMIHIVYSRLTVLKKSFLNVGKCNTCGR